MPKSRTQQQPRELGLCVRELRLSLRNKEATKVIALGSSLNMVSIAGAVGVCAAVGYLLPAGLAWLLAPFLASMTYLLVTAVEMMAARRIQEARNVQ